MRDCEKTYPKVAALDAKFHKMVQILPSSALSIKSFLRKPTDAGEKGGPTRREIQANEVAQLAQDNFPPCMREMAHQLTKDGRIKFFGRQQLFPFLKGIGMPHIELKRLLSQHIGDLKKRSEYEYYIDYVYGLRGRRQESIPMGCHHMVEGTSPSGDDAFGCPFQHSGDLTLKKMLKGHGFAPREIEEIVAERNQPRGLNKPLNPELGCRRYYAFKHPQALTFEGVGRHPNSYFAASSKCGRGILEHKRWQPETVIVDQPKTN